MAIQGKALKVFTGPDCGAVASPEAVVHPTVGAKDGGLPARVLNALTRRGSRAPKVAMGPAVGPGASVIRLK